MNKSVIVLGAAVVTVILATSAFAANRGATFTGIGFIENPGPFPASDVVSMNPEGTVFMATPTIFGNYCIQWTREGGWGTEVGQALSACRMSSNGTIMATGLYPGSDPAYGWPGTWAGQANVWNPIPPPADYEPCGQPGIAFFDMGGDGDFATGLTWRAGCVARPFRWDRVSDSTETLPTPDDRGGRGNAISKDGRTVVGWSSTLFGIWRGARWRGGTPSWIDGQGNIEPKVCVSSGKSCTADYDDPVYGCPEYVDDSHCDTASCTAAVCVGGPHAGDSCRDDYECEGYCIGGPNAGGLCDQDYYCPDSMVCIDNPAWSNAAFKGEARDISDKGHVVGRNFGYDLPEWNDAYRQNPDGSFTVIPTDPSFPETWEPRRISKDGKTVVGTIGSPFVGNIAAFWNEGTGTQDLQLLLLAQGLDEMFFWSLHGVHDVSADGTIMAGSGTDPDFKEQGFIVDLKRLWVCHEPPGHPENAFTMSMDFRFVRSHLAHGDYLGTCDFLNSGGLSRAAALRERLQKNKNVSVNAYGIDNKPTRLNGPMTPDVRWRIDGGTSPSRIAPTMSNSRVPPARSAATPKTVRD